MKWKRTLGVSILIVLIYCFHSVAAVAAGEDAAGQKVDGRPAWTSLFDGKTLNGWHTVGDGQWVVENGAIVGKTQKGAKLYGLLVSEKKFKNLRVKFKFKSLEGNSGFYVRCNIKPPDQAHGLQVEVDPRNNTGGIYESYGRAWISQPAPEVVEKAYKLDRWNDMEILADGGHVVTRLNGAKIAELKNDPVVDAGHLVMQMHSGNKMLVMFKDIKVLDLDKKAAEQEPVKE